MPKFFLALYVTSKDSGKALAELYKILELWEYTDYELTIIDVMNDRELALEAGITQTPVVTLIGDSGLKQYAGDLKDHARAREVLGLT
ncbi:MAG: hypothetical protein K2W95_24290 [Candidatus Obscuribacterales bacterium]|nr:hypothetical protein [Candidatus Obscuribacterales bacterium]